MSGKFFTHHFPLIAFYSCQGTEEVFEHEELDKHMSYVSFKYNDGCGFNNSMAKRLMSGLFQDFDQFEATVENPVMKIEEDTAVV